MIIIPGEVSVPSGAQRKPSIMPPSGSAHTAFASMGQERLWVADRRRNNHNWVRKGTTYRTSRYFHAQR